MKKIIILTFLIMVMPLVIAFNDPGHDSLYVLKIGDTITGTLNVTEDVHAVSYHLTERIFGPYLRVRADGETSSADINRIVGTLSGLEISSQQELKLNPGSGGIVRVGGTTPADLNVTGSLWSQGRLVCLENGTNCPALGEGFEGVLPVTQGGTGRDSGCGDEQLLLWNTSSSAWECADLPAGEGGTVTSVNVSGGDTGLTTTGGPITEEGTITLSGTLLVGHGGTGRTSGCEENETLVWQSGEWVCGEETSFSFTGNTITNITFSENEYDGNIINGSYTGYDAANNICKEEFDGWLCHEYEIISYMRENEVILSGMGFVVAGGSKFVPADKPVNDCNGFTTNSVNNMANFWNFDVGYGIVTHCGTESKLVCCK